MNNHMMRSDTREEAPFRIALNELIRLRSLKQKIKNKNKTCINLKEHGICPDGLECSEKHKPWSYNQNVAVDTMVTSLDRVVTSGDVNTKLLNVIIANQNAQTILINEILSRFQNTTNNNRINESYTVIPHSIATTSTPIRARVNTGLNSINQTIRRDVKK
nr:MAG: glycoprotein [Vaokses virus]